MGRLCKNFLEATSLALGGGAFLLYLAAESGVSFGDFFGLLSFPPPFRGMDAALTSGLGVFIGLLLQHIKVKNRGLVFWGTVLSVVMLFVSMLLR